MNCSSVNSGQIKNILLVLEIVTAEQVNMARACVPSLSLWKFLRKARSLSLFLLKMASICGGFLGFATNTYTNNDRIR